ncbi:MAG: helix-turn-helix transcriptional regulator [Panacagrimonas sp.]
MDQTGLAAAHTAKATRDTDRAERLLRLNEVLSRVGVSRSTLYAWISDGAFPAPVRLSQHLSAWPESSVSAWIELRIATSRAAKHGAK